MNLEELKQQYSDGIRNFSGIDLSEQNLKDIYLGGANLEQAKFIVSNLSGSNFTGANLFRAKLNVARLSSANFQKATLNQATLNVANLIQCNLQEAEVKDAEILYAEFIRAQLSDSDLRGSIFNGSDLRESIFRRAKMQGCQLNEVKLQKAIFNDAVLNQVEIKGSDVSKADFTGAVLNEGNLVQSDFSYAKFVNAQLVRTLFYWSDLTGANFSGADLSYADLKGADLTRANLKGANLKGANLVNANLKEANLIGVSWEGQTLVAQPWTGVKLYGVSRVGIKTRGVECEWVDMSAQGDRSNVQRLKPHQVSLFFHEILPKIEININAAVDFNSNLLLASVYKKLAKNLPSFERPPSIKSKQRGTVMQFEMKTEDDSIPLLYAALFPFFNQEKIIGSILKSLKIVRGKPIEEVSFKFGKAIDSMLAAVQNLERAVEMIPLPPKQKLPRSTANFFNGITQIKLINSRDDELIVYRKNTGSELNEMTSEQLAEEIKEFFAYD
ncbi:MAG: pentapeptide repeat-containing protein [Synechococcaceae cyanobacterium RL_1_2]|nr:pentapeptide repeat-containing protein [Synechococcaceae cyanobacterium RL_1_2]